MDRTVVADEEALPDPRAAVALCMIDLKLARLAHDPGNYDSMVDVAGYAAVLREMTR